MKMLHINRPCIKICHKFAFLPFIDLSEIWRHDLAGWCPSSVKYDGPKWNINNNWEEHSLVSVTCINLIFAEKSLFISGCSNPSIWHDKRQTVVWKCFILMTRGAVAKDHLDAKFFFLLLSGFDQDFFTLRKWPLVSRFYCKINGCMWPTWHWADLVNRYWLGFDVLCRNK